MRGIEDGQTEPSFPENFTDVTVRDEFYNREFAFFERLHGSSGHDSPLIAWVVWSTDGEVMVVSLYLCVS